MMLGRAGEVLASLRPRRERPREKGSQRSTPVRDCWRYLERRQGQLDFKGARERGLPIGSGEVESAHRYVVQARPGKAGAWWRLNNAQAMARLRVMRLNGRWDGYWASKEDRLVPSL